MAGFLFALPDKRFIHQNTASLALEGLVMRYRFLINVALLLAIPLCGLGIFAAVAVSRNAHTVIDVDYMTTSSIKR
jgi:hypothetical protein